jgi:hypothetical protein
MKRTDLEKKFAMNLDQRMKKAGTPQRFAGAAAPDRKEQRRIDQAKGLLPFAVKLDSALIAELHALAASRQIGMNELVGELLRKGMA